VGGGKKAGVGALASTKGSVKSAIPNFTPGASRQKIYGTILQSISINYCSEAGLVCRRVVVPGEIKYTTPNAPTPPSPYSAVLAAPRHSNVLEELERSELERRGHQA